MLNLHLHYKLLPTFFPPKNAFNNRLKTRASILAVSVVKEFTHSFLSSIVVLAFGNASCSSPSASNSRRWNASVPSVLQTRCKLAAISEIIDGGIFPFPASTTARNSATAALPPSTNITPASALASAYLAYYACCGGDTWASELGVLSKSKPRLITNWAREVTPGTNGGVTALGWASSASGGAVVGAAFHVGQTALRAFASDGLVAHEPSNALVVIGFSALAGVFGSLVDSVLGATIQFSGYCEERKRVVSKPGPTVTRISGLEVLSNIMVNLVSGIITAVVAYALAPL